MGELAKLQERRSTRSLSDEDQIRYLEL